MASSAFWLQSHAFLGYKTLWTEMPHNKKLHKENARPNYKLKLWSRISFKMNLYLKNRRPFSKIAFKMDIDQK